VQQAPEGLTAAPLRFARERPRQQSVALQFEFSGPWRGAAMAQGRLGGSAYHAVNPASWVRRVRAML
jgi:hypothetical protein